MSERPYDPSDLTDHRSERARSEFVDDSPPGGSGGGPSTSGGAGGGKSRTGLIVAVIAAVVLIGGGAAVVVGMSGGEAPVAAPASSEPVSEPSVEVTEEPAAEETTAPEETEEPAADESVAVADPEPVITKVNETVAVSYPSKVVALTAADKKAILALAQQPLAEDEQVVVSGFAGTTATEEFGQQISLQRAEVIQAFLARNGVQAQIVGYGKTPVGDVLSDSQDASITTGLDDGRLKKSAVNDNRLAFVSAVVVDETSP